MYHLIFEMYQLTFDTNHSDWCQMSNHTVYQVSQSLKVHMSYLIVVRTGNSLTLCILMDSAYWFSVVFFMVPWVGLQCVIVVIPDHTHFLIQ